MKRLFYILIFLGVVTTSNAQYVHFSQFTASPLNLNPAMTGVFNGEFRFAGIFKNQWASVSSPYVSYSGSVDGAFFRRKFRGNSLGLGAVFSSDVAGDANYGGQSYLLSVAYRLILTKYSSISMGIQSGIAQTGYDRNSLQFGSQYQGGAFAPTNPDGENFGTERFTKLDMNAGLLYMANLDKTTNVYLGVAANHLNRSSLSFLSRSWKNYAYFNVHGGIDFALNDEWSMSPNIWLLKQGPNSEIMFGSYLSYKLMAIQGDEDTQLSFGAWYRYGDGLIAAMKLEFMIFQFAFSYDINLSKLSPASGGMGGPELSLIIIGPADYRPRGFNQPCPRF